ncbi:hypothetical protein ONS96_002339 [Cadophora gregata f. sp. sojae]|nr:hypothetical protein ONS96_002339 [Cadophora gregata f. sp. sojae]
MSWLLVQELVSFPITKNALAALVPDQSQAAFTPSKYAHPISIRGTQQLSCTISLRVQTSQPYVPPDPVQTLHLAGSMAVRGRSSSLLIGQQTAARKCCMHIYF